MHIVQHLDFLFFLDQISAFENDQHQWLFTRILQWHTGVVCHFPSPNTRPRRL